MGKRLMNLTLSVVTTQIEDVLTTYPDYPYQQAFTHSDLRLKLTAYVLSRIPNKYAVIEETESFSTKIEPVDCSTEKQLHIENLIHCGICDVLNVYNQAISHPPQLENRTPTF